MPSLIGSLFVSLTADFGGFNRNMAASERRVDAAATGMRRSIGLTSQSVSNFQRQVSAPIRPYALISAARAFDSTAARANLLRGSVLAVTAAFGGLGAALTSNVVSRYLDSFTNLSNQIRVVSDGAADLKAQIGAVGGVADRTRTSLAATATLYSRLAKAQPGEDPAKLLRRVETINKGLQLGGATAQEAASAAIQFSQAIQSNRLGGEELRAVLETPLGGALAKGLNVTIAQFRKMSLEGKLTADVLMKSLDNVANEIDQKFARSIVSIDGALTIADNSITRYAGKLDQTYGITRALSSGIIDLASNLETLVPILVSGAASAGSLFSGRIAGGFLRSRVDLIREEYRARQDNLAAARQDVELAKQSLNLAQERQAAPKRPVFSAAPKADVKAYERDVAALEKADARHLSLLQRKGDVTRQIGEIYKTTTLGEIRAAQALSDQQVKLNGLYEQRRIAAQKVRGAETALTGAVGLQSQTSAKLRAPIEAQKALTAARREQSAVLKTISTEENRLEVQRATLIKQTSASYAQAAQQRADVLTREKQLTAEIIRSEGQRADLLSRTRIARSTVEKSGAGVLAKESAEAAREVSRTVDASYRAQVAMREAAKSATILATGFGLVSRAATSLWAFLGGGWGVALTTAIGLMATFAAKSREAAMEQERFNQIVRERVGRAAESPGPNQATAQLSLIEERQKALQEELAVAERGYAKIIKGVGDWAKALNEVEEAQDRAAGGGQTKFRDYFLQFEAGTLSLDDLIAKTRSLEGLLPDRMFRRLIATLINLKDEVKDPTIALEDLRKELVEIDGKVAEAKVKVSVEVDDKYGIFAPGGSLKLGDFGLDRNPIGNPGLTGLPPDLVKIQADLFKKETLDRARNDKTQEIKDRAKELFELGRALGLTQEEATALAAEEIRLKDAQKESTKSTNEAAREYKKFSAAIAELKETARGSFLSDIDQKVLAQADNLKNGAAMMGQYIDAINSGDMSKAPTELLQIRDALMQIGAADTWRDIIDQYGKGAQLTQRFADKQAELNFLVGTGRITADQAKLAWADFLTQFADYQWIDDVADAFANFAESAVMDFENIEDAAASLLKEIARIILQMTLLEPLKNALRGGLSSWFGGGFSGGGSAGFNPTAMFGEIIGAIAKPGALAAGSSGMFTTANAAVQMTDTVAKATGNSVAEQAWNYFKGKGLSDIQTAGILGNIKAESAFNPAAVGDAGKAFGLFQHWANRGGGQGLIKSGVQGQLDHAWGELTTTEIKALTALKGSTDLRSATGAFAGFERPRGFSWNNPEGAHNFEGRLKGAEEALQKFGGSTGAAKNSVDSMTTSATNAKDGLNSFGNGLSNVLNRIGTGPGGAGGIVGGLLKNIFGQTLSATASAAVLGGAGGLYHGGGRAGTASTFKFADFSHAPRYHNGLRANELTAILQQGEHVLTERQGDRMKDTVGGLIKSIGSGGAPGMIAVNVEGANGDQHVIDLVRQGVELGLRQYDKSFDRKAVAAVNIGKQRGSFR